LINNKCPSTNPRCDVVGTKIGRNVEQNIPVLSSQPINPFDTNGNFTKQQNGNNLYTVDDYLGNKVVFDSNSFGGTNNTNNIGNVNNTVNTNNANNANNTNNVQITKVETPISDNGGKIVVNPDDIYSNSSSLNTFSSIDVNPNIVVRPTKSSNQNTIQTINNGLKWHEQSFDPRQYAHAENLDQIGVVGGKTRNDLLVNHMIYSDFNRLPPSFNDKDFEYGYSFLPPKDWYPVPTYPPVCVSSKTCDVKPVYLDSTTMDLKEWHETQKITPPDSINTTFITNELNSKV
jgi:hypothetical protein